MSALALGIPVAYLVTLAAFVVIEAEKYAHRSSEYGDRRPDVNQGTDGHTTTPSNGEDGGTKTPDPVISGGGHDYAGLAIPVRGPITAKTRLGIGHIVRSSTPLTADHRQIREAVKYAIKKVARKRRRPMHDTRSWGKIRKRLQFDPLGVVDEFRMDYQRARRAAGMIADAARMVQQGHFHLQ